MEVRFRRPDSLGDSTCYDADVNKRFSSPVEWLLHIIVLSLCLLAPSCAQRTQPVAPASTQPAKPHHFQRWESDIAAYEAADKIHAPPSGAVEFIGSSTVARWKTIADYFPGQTILNRGFGGSEIVDATYFADRILIPYAPQKVFLISGTNDIANGRSPEEVAEDFKAFAAKVRSKLPETKIYFVSANPRPIRWAQRDKNRQCNQLIEAWCKSQKNVIYIETYDLTITKDETPIEGIWADDRLHLNEEGYKLLAERVRTYVEE